MMSCKMMSLHFSTALDLAAFCDTGQVKAVTVAFALTIPLPDSMTLALEPKADAAEATAGIGGGTITVAAGCLKNELGSITVASHEFLCHH